MRSILTLAIVGAVVAASIVPALAVDCPALIKRITDEAGNRFDDAAYQAKQKAAEAEAAHAQKNEEKCEKAAKEGLAILGLKA